MASFDDLDAPQFSTFDDYDQEEAEQYFEIDHESERLKSKIQEDDDESYYSPMNKNSVDPDNVLELRNRRIRRSLSCDDMQIPTKSFSSLRLNDEKQSSEVEAKAHQVIEYGTLRKGNMGNSQSNLRFCTQESLNRLAAPKRIHSSTGNLSQQSQEYVSVAEAVRKFHEKTPNRFHSKNKNTSVPKNCGPPKLKATIAISPCLLTKKRIKKNNHVVSREQQLLLEFEKEQKFKVKAHPVNKKILESYVKPVQVEKKPTTVTAPFNLTEVQPKKITTPKREYHQFHAKPVPKYVVQPPKLPKKQDVKITQPMTPTFLKKLPKPSPPKKVEQKTTTQVLRNTKPVPFSFEKRDQRLMNKKEEMIKKVVEEEKKAREFHARPIPKSIMNKQKQKSLGGSSSSLNQCEKSDHVEKFKARPATVLYQKPFEPKKYEQPLTEIQPFVLNSEMRAQEREKFEQKKREQEEIAASILRQEENERLRREEEERRRIREETKFKAQPIKNFKGVIVEPSGKVTEPISPVFLSGKSNRKNKENEI